MVTLQTVTGWSYTRRTVTHAGPVCFRNGTVQIEHSICPSFSMLHGIYPVHCILLAPHGHLPRLQHIQHSLQVSRIYSCPLLVSVRRVKCFNHNIQEKSPRNMGVQSCAKCRHTTTSISRASSKKDTQQRSVWRRMTMPDDDTSEKPRDCSCLASLYPQV